MQDARIAKFEKRRAELAQLNDQQLKTLFWELCDKIVEPMLEYGKNYTSPSIERSVLHRMGLNTAVSKELVSKITEAGLLGKGAGNILLKYSQKHSLSLPEAAAALIKTPEAMNTLFKKEN